ncbi:MAG: hypothetical protein ACYS0D_15995 [Planctomycetota bacterium]|jgi:chromosome segregation ATPase
MISNIRVLDERAFTEFAGKLSELIKEAATSSKTLDDLVTRTHSLSESATSAKSQLDQRLELSARVLKITKGQLDRVEGALGALNDSQRKVDDLSADLKKQLGQFNTHLEHAMEEVDQRVTKAVDGLEEQRRDGDQSRSELEQLLGLARRLGEHFASVEGQLAGGVEAFQQGLREALEEIASGNTRADRASSKLDEQVFALKSRVVAFADGIEQWLKPALTEMEAQRKDMGRVSDDVRQQFNELSARVGQALQDIEDRINIGLGDLSSRHQGSERETVSIRAALDDLRTQWTEDIRTRLVDELRAHIDATCVNQTDLAARLGELQGRLEASLNRVGDEVSATLDDFNTRTRNPDVDKDATAHRSQLADNQAHLSEVLVRIEDRLSEALRGLDDHRDAEADFVASHLSAIREQLSSLGSRMETEVEPLLATLRQRLRDDLEHKIIAATERLDSRCWSSCPAPWSGSRARPPNRCAPSSKRSPMRRNERRRGLPTSGRSSRRRWTRSPVVSPASSRVWAVSTRVSARSPIVSRPSASVRRRAKP